MRVRPIARGIKKLKGADPSYISDFTTDRHRVGALSYQSFNNLYATTRATTAWDVVDGTLEEYASGEPILNSKGLWVGEASTNLLTNNDGALATYTSAGDIADGTPFITGFDNSLDISSTSTLTYAHKTYAYSSSTEYTFSAYVKMADNSEPVVATSSSDAAGSFAVIMYGVVAATTSLESVGAGIYRVSATVNSASLTLQTFGVTKYAANADDAFSVLGFQLEQSDFASPIIITEGSAVTRNADVIVNNAAISSWYNQNEGTIFMQANSLAGSGAPTLFQIDAGTTATKHVVYRDTANTRVIGWTRNASATEAIFASGSDPYAGGAKYAYAYKNNDFELAIAGSSIGVDLSGTTPTSMIGLRLGSVLGGTAQLNGYIQEFEYYNTRLPQADMERITS